MASFLIFSLFCTAALCISSSLAQASFRPKALVLPVTKDSSTLRYPTRINQRTPLVPVSLTLDLGGQFLWVDCEKGYVSSTYHPARCRSPQCNLAGLTACVVSTNTCGLTPDNAIIRTATFGDLGSDIVSFQSTDGKKPGRVVSQPNFLFVCSPTFLLEGLAAGVKGMAGLASAYTEGDASSEYFIRVKSIKINEKVVPLNTNLLSINKTDGYGGTKISTVNPFTVLETSIYNAVVKAFVNQLSGIPRVASVAPFGACFSSKNIGGTRVGPAVSQIDLVLQNESVYRRIFGANSMVQSAVSAIVDRTYYTLNAAQLL
ncbi:hypothetical protein RJ640_028894 [Escallonia rubra]|uniref:Uncharacterized protein n=1 Tax=Escallonia rubra TaxID=112253 RepID=A0AA88U0L8_9ASTE|nr:hypothetical protein RJ640_028894 [Escallonia rubra]